MPSIVSANLQVFTNIRNVPDPRYSIEIQYIPGRVMKMLLKIRKMYIYVDFLYTSIYFKFYIDTQEF